MIFHVILYVLLCYKLLPMRSLFFYFKFYYGLLRKRGVNWYEIIRGKDTKGWKGAYGKYS